MSEAATIDAPEPAVAAQPFSFGGEAARPVSALPALDRISERLAKRLRDALEPLARVKPKVEASRVVVQRFGGWRGEQPEFTSLSLYRFRPLKGGMLLAIQPELVARLVDTFYGGSGNTTARGASEFTGIEERVLARLSETIVGALGEVWSEVKLVQIELAGRETNATYAALARAEEPVAIARFSVALSQGHANTIQILYPVSSLRTIESELAAKANSEGGSAGFEWRARMAEALGDVRIETRSVLARPTLSVLELLKLAPGDVIPISLPALVPLNVGGQTVALGTIGENDGRAALRIEKVGKGIRS